MNTQTTTATRESILQQLGSITLMRRGTLSEQSFERKTPDGRTVRFGPYFKFQIWQDGRNQTRRVAADEAQTLREDIDNFHRFEELCGQLAQLNIQQTIALRASTAVPETAEKKTSNPNASPKNTAKPNTSSPKRAKGSPKKNNNKP